MAKDIVISLDMVRIAARLAGMPLRHRRGCVFDE